MSDNGKERFILTKAYEIAYALFRLASQMQEKDFSEKLRAAGATLLEATAAEDHVSAMRSVQVIECLVKFAGDVNVIGTTNADVILREIYVLDKAIAERKNAPKTDAVNLAEIFSKSETVADSAKSFAKDAEPAYNEPAPAIISNEEPATNINGILKSAIRQTAILERIRQSGNCRLKDIQEILPEASERTIRYDLQTLLEQNLIERIGNAGPSVFYRATQAA
jgi:DeoR-like helix-turn-helix domain